MTETTDNTQAIIDLARLSNSPFSIGSAGPDALIHLLPENVTAELTDLEQYAANPRRARGTVRPGTVTDLVDYLKRFGDERLTVWVHPNSGRVEAVLDDHLPRILGESDGTVVAPPEAGFGDHRAVLELAHTPEWEIWLGANNRSFSQTDFAEHIEANGKEIIDPTAADMLEIAQSFHATGSSHFSSAKRLQDGTTQLVHNEELNATAGKTGQLEVPAELKLAIRPFVGEPAYAVTARLRYRVSGGNLSLSYKLDRPDDVVRDALAGVAARLVETFDNVYVGTPR